MATSRGLGQSRDHVSLSRMLHQNAEIVAAVPIFISSPLYRRWHLRWGATDEEVAEPMPGDEFVPVAHFVATRAITICAPPAAVWPWIMQVGFGRAGFYSYDLFDNLGRPSAEDLHMEWQQAHVGDLAAPMTNPPTTDTSFTVHDVKSTEYVVWSKPGLTWVWMLKPLDATRTVSSPPLDSATCLGRRQSSPSASANSATSP